MHYIAFKRKITQFYKRNGRSFPWRPPVLKTKNGIADPYAILVSEVMLQQTQTHRVIPKYRAFLATFPNVHALAAAPRLDLLRLWQGLGYNRRALYLQRVAHVIVAEKASVFPDSYEALLTLPGVGPYTAAAVMAFAYNKPSLMIETNIRAALLHEFFPRSRAVSDKKLEAILKRLLPKKNIREFYQALMDYGAFLKQKYPNPSRRSAHHAVQAAFHGSVRELRGAIIRALTTGAYDEFERMQRASDPRLELALDGLVRDGLVARKGTRYAIAN